MINLSTVEINNDLAEGAFEKKDLVDNSGDHSNQNLNHELTNKNKLPAFDGESKEAIDGESKEELNHEDNLNKNDLDTKVHVISEINEEKKINNKYVEKNFLENDNEIKSKDTDLEKINLRNHPYDNLKPSDKSNTFNLIEEQKELQKKDLTD